MASFSTFRSRLIFLFALATFPAVALALTLSWHVYMNAKAANENGWQRAALAASTQVAVLLRNAAGTLHILAAVPAQDAGEPACGKGLGSLVLGQGGYRTVGVVRSQGTVCVSGDAKALDGFEWTALSTALWARTAETAAPAIAVNAVAGNVAVVAPTLAGDGAIVVVIDRDAIERALADVAPGEGGTVAVVDGSLGILAARGLGHDRPEWMPNDGSALRRGATLMAASRDGRSFAYVMEPVGIGALAVVAGFPAIRIGPAERQLAIGLAFPFVLFVIVLAVAWLAIDRLFLHWVRRLDSAARRLAFGDFSVRAELPGDAPLELRQYANAFDQMTDVLASRTGELATVAQQRSQLLRELHHRVKNNFQVIASFLNLMKRARVGETREALAFAESRVHAMAAAYKLALAQGDIRMVPVSALVEDVVNYVQHAADMVRRNVQVALDAPGAFLILDRAIPLALVLVETLWPLVTNPAREAISVEVGKEGDRLRLVVRGAAGEHPAVPERRFQRAFLQQIEAVALADPPTDAVLIVSLPVEWG